MKTLKKLLIIPLLAFMATGYAATITISGMVTNNGSPAYGIQVTWTDSSTMNTDTATTNAAGFYTLNLNIGTSTQGMALGQINACNGIVKYRSFFYNPGQSSYARQDFIYCNSGSGGSFTATISGLVTNLPSTGSYDVYCDTLGGAFPNFTRSVSKNANSYSFSVVAMNNPQDFWVYIIDCKGDTSMKMIRVASSSPNSTGNNFNYCAPSSGPTVSGTVYAGSALTNNATVLLIESYQGNLTAVDSTSTQRGYYSFRLPQPTRTYYVKAFLGSTDPLYNFYMPTYSDLALRWSQANIIPAAPSGTYTRDINLIAGVNSGGPGFVGGRISQGANKSSAVGDPIEGAQVLLMKGTDAVAFTYSDAQGEFGFSNIAYGTYTVYTEVAGLPTTSADVTIDAGNESEEGVRVSINSTGVTTWIETTGVESFGEFASMTAYPNPVQNNLIIDFGQLVESGTVEVFDLAGALQQNIDFEQVSTVDVNFNELNAGNYIVKVQSENGLSTIRIVKH